MGGTNKEAARPYPSEPDLLLENTFDHINRVGMHLRNGRLDLAKTFSDYLSQDIDQLIRNKEREEKRLAKGS